DRSPADARPWIDAAKPEHPSLIDTRHVVADLYNMVNVPTIVWIDERGRIVRPNDVAFGTDTFKHITGPEAAKHLGALRAWGRGVALALAGAGARVVVNDLGASLAGEGGDARPAAQVVDEIVKAGGAAVPNFGSVADVAEAAAMVEQVIRTYGRIDILVHVAGILRDRMVFNMTQAEWDAVIAVHLKGMFNAVRAASIAMRETCGGRIIGMSSVSALGAPGQPNYAAAKAGILGLTWSTANALAKYGVTTNAILPSGATRMIDSTPRGREVFAETGKWPSELAAETERDPDNVAPL